MSPRHKQTEAFQTAEDAGIEQPKRKPDMSRVAAPLTEDGAFDMSSMRTATREKLIRAIKATPELAAEAGLPAEENPLANFIKPEHVKLMLSIFSQAEQLIVPRYVDYKIRLALKKELGRIPLPAEVIPHLLHPAAVNAALVYTEEEKERLAEPGAQALNQVLPDWLKKWLAETGPAAEFLVAFGIIEYQKFSRLMQLDQQYKASDAQQQSKQPTNGHDRETWKNPEISFEPTDAQQ